MEASVWVAESTGVPKMLIGATIVSLATTLPEFFVSVIAVSNGATGLGIGNALGSVICNTGLILALSIIVKPSKVDNGMFYKKAVIMILSLAILFVMSLDKTLSPTESIPLLMMLALFVYVNVRHAKKSSLNRQKEITGIDTSKKAIGINILKFATGAAGIVVGADLLVNNGVVIARSLGVSEGVIGVTIVALGTSLPELVTTITALKKKHVAMGIGNILGANTLNFTLILSTCALVSDNGLDVGAEGMRSIYIDMPIAALLFMILLIPPLLFKGRMKRFQGVAMMAVYAGFILYLILSL